MDKHGERLMMTVLSALSPTPVGTLAYRMMRKQKIEPKPLLHFSQLMPNNTKEVHLTAHRGLSAVCPENTVESFEAGGKAGFYALECDTHCTVDGTWVVMHDPQIETMFDGKGDVKTYTYDQLQHRKMINGANLEKFSDIHMCTLQAYLDICKKYGCRPMIEVKDPRIEKMQSLYQLLQENKVLESCIIISFHIGVLRALAGIDQSLEMWYLIDKISDKRIEEAKFAGFNFGIAFCAQYNAPFPELIQKVHDNGLTAACWTVDSKALLQTMLDCGVKYITSNSILPD